MGNYVPVPLNVRAALDTAMPETDRSPGTLVTAVETHHRYWGPRRGTKAFTSAYEASGSAMGYNYISFDGVDDLAQTDGVYGQGANLGTQWTLDLYFNLTNYTYAPTKDYIALYTYALAGGVGFYPIRVLIDRRTNHQGEIIVKINTTSAPNTPDSVVTLTWTGGGSSNTRRHITIVRDGATCALFENGVQVASTGVLAATHPHEDVYNGYARVAFSNPLAGDEAYFLGKIYMAVLRTSADLTRTAREESGPTYCGSDIRHYYVGTVAEIGMGSYDYLWDIGPFGAHALLGGSPTWGSIDQLPPFFAPTQGFGTCVTVDGKTMQAAVVGGRLYTKYTA